MKRDAPFRLLGSLAEKKTLRDGQRLVLGLGLERICYCLPARTPARSECNGFRREHSLDRP